MESKKNRITPNPLLRKARELRGWSQSYVAEQVQAPAVSYISRWERGIASPSPYYREKLCKLFEKNAYELGLLQEEDPAREDIPAPSNPEEASTQTTSSTPWNVPYRRNLFFTGCENILAYLANFLAPQNNETALQPLALSGLAGIGKTQIAIEYTYRYRNIYSAILWIRSNSYKDAIADILAIGEPLQFPERDSQNFTNIIELVRHWLENKTGWLLVLDNVTDLEELYKFLPTTGNGHILVTTQSQATGTLTHNRTLEPMKPEDGALFLLHRAKLLSAEHGLEHAEKTVRTTAIKIAQMMGGLPLALDQVGAYVEETHCSLPNYIDLYQRYQRELLNRRGRHHSNYPESVSTTLSLCIEKVQQSNPVAIDLLHFCTFLSPDSIPEELCINNEGNEHLPIGQLATNQLQLDEVLGSLFTYSLIKRDSQTKMLYVHRLTQSILQSRFSVEQQKEWAQKVVQEVNRIFPENGFTKWANCKRYLPQVHACAELIERYQLVSIDAARLLYEAGYFLLEQAQYAHSERFLLQACTIYEQTVGNQDVATAKCFSTLATLYTFLKKYQQAEQLFQRTLHIYIQHVGEGHPRVAECYNDLASLDYYLGQETQAEQLYLQALSIWENNSATNPEDLASALNNLATLYSKQGKYAQALPLLQRALQIWEQHLGPDHPDLAFGLNALAKFYQQQECYRKAEKLFTRALVLREQTLGANHPRVASSLHALASLYNAWHKYTLAEPLYTRALHILQPIFGTNHDEVQAIRKDIEDIRSSQNVNGACSLNHDTAKKSIDNTHTIDV